MLNDVFLELIGISSREAVNLIFVLDEQKCWHAGNVVFHCQIFALIDVHLKVFKYYFRQEILKQIVYKINNFTFSTTTLSTYVTESSCNFGAIALPEIQILIEELYRELFCYLYLQGPHQVAWKSTTTNLSPALSS